MNNHIVFGLGEVGMAVYDNLKRNRYIRVLGKDKDSNELDINGVDTIHICYPWSDAFISDTQQYIDNYEPDLVIIYSTVPIGTTANFKQAVHSPVEGRHPHLAQSIGIATRFIGCNNKDLSLKAADIWRDLGCNTLILADSKWTEFLKLRSTAKFGINLVWTDYEAAIADELDMPFTYLKMFDSDYNHIYSNMGLSHINRYILDPPKGKIGGHCVVSNAELLNKQFPNEMLDRIISMGGLT